MSRVYTVPTRINDQRDIQRDIHAGEGTNKNEHVTKHGGHEEHWTREIEKR